jgi:hypothetical protein
MKMANSSFDSIQENRLEIVVFTAIFGGKDEAPKLVNKDKLPTGLKIDFRCVTDNPELKSEDYQIEVAKQKYADVTKNARDIKLNGFKGIEKYNVAIWHDSSVQLHCDKISDLAKFADNHIISVFHHVRYCAYLEAVACITQNKDSALRIAAQMYRYFREGFPSNYKLHETTIMVLDVANYYKSELRKVWWDEILHRSRRDQLSFAYARWVTGVKAGLLAHWKVNRTNNEYSTWIGHKHERYYHSNFLLKINSRIIKWICKKLIYKMRHKR